MEVLARHSARLDRGGRKLEATVKVLVKKARRILISQRDLELGDEDIMARWDFFHNPRGRAEYEATRSKFHDLYEKHGRGPKGDAKVLEACTTEDEPPLQWCEGPATTEKLLAFGGGCGDKLLPLEVGEIHFAHDVQNELFGLARKGGEDGNLLQTAVELLGGITDPELVPAFDVCRHEGKWFARTGNRRLAVVRLLRAVAPLVFRSVAVREAAADEAFLHGSSFRRPKLTTGRECAGRWMVIRETDEAVGVDHGMRPYGMDLLGLLPPVAGWTTRSADSFAGGA